MERLVNNTVREKLIKRSGERDLPGFSVRTFSEDEAEVERFAASTAHANPDEE